MAKQEVMILGTNKTGREMMRMLILPIMALITGFVLALFGFLVLVSSAANILVGIIPLLIGVLLITLGAIFDTKIRKKYDQ